MCFKGISEFASTDTDMSQDYISIGLYY